MAFDSQATTAMSADEIRAGVERLSPWFYSFELQHGQRTQSALPPTVEPIHATRREMMERVVRAHFGARLNEIDALDIGCHEGYFSLALSKLGVRRVVGLEPREESLERARFIARASGITNVEYTTGQVETLATEHTVYPLTLYYGVLYHVMDPMIGLRNVAAVTGELCMIETQVVDEVDGVTEWGSREWTRNYHGILALIDESGEFDAGNRETGVAPLVTCPSPRALTAMLRHAGFQRVEYITPAEGAYEQHARGKRVVVAAWK